MEYEAQNCIELCLLCVITRGCSLLEGMENEPNEDDLVCFIHTKSTDNKKA